MINMKYFGAITSRNDFMRHIGKKVYLVHSLGERGSYLTEIVVTGTIMRYSSEFAVGFAATSEKTLYNYEFSLYDANVITNEYNGHYVFTDKTKAETYLNFCKTKKFNEFD